MSGPVKCPSCAEPVPTRPGPGRQARFCSDRCRSAHRRATVTVPARLRSQRRWVRAVGKRPVTTTGSPASSTNPATWASFEQVRAARAGDGFGVMLGGGLGCYDLDDVTDVDARRFAATIPERVLFAERSVSGRGVHLFVEADEADGWRRTIDGMKVERYTRARFIRMTLQKIALRDHAGSSTPGPEQDGPTLTVAAAAAAGSHRDLLIAMRSRLATAVDNPATAQRDLASLTRRLMEIAKEITALDQAAAAELEHGGEAEGGHDGDGDEEWGPEAL